MYELIMGLNNKYFFVTLPNLNLEQRLYDDYRADESSWNYSVQIIVNAH